jgi:hypothetical protein
MFVQPYPHVKLSLIKEQESNKSLLEIDIVIMKIVKKMQDMK